MIGINPSGAQIMAASQANAGLGQTTLDMMMAAVTDPQREAKRTQHYDFAVKELKLPHGLAMLHANHQVSPYAALKYHGTPLPLDAERLLETEIIQVALRTRNAVNDLLSRGLVRPLPNIGVFTDVWKRESNQQPASIGMNLAGGPEYDRQTFDTQGVPVPIIQKRFEFETRELMAAANNGTSLDTSHAARAAQMVAEAEENMLINGETLAFGGFNIYGYRTHPNRLTDTAAGDFGTPANIFDTFNAAQGIFRSNNQNGPTVYYVSPNQFTECLVDHKANGNESALQRSLGIPNIADIKFNQYVPDGEIVGVVMNPASVDLAVAQNVTTVPWETEGGARQHWRVFSSMVPRIKPDSSNQVGVIHITGA